MSRIVISPCSRFSLSTSSSFSTFAVYRICSASSSVVVSGAVTKFSCVIT